MIILFILSLIILYIILCKVRYPLNIRFLYFCIVWLNGEVLPKGQGLIVRALLFFHYLFKKCMFFFVFLFF